MSLYPTVYTPTNTLAAAVEEQVAAEHGPTTQQYFHVAPDGKEEPYSPEVCQRLQMAMATMPGGGRLTVASSLPFEVRWGSEATSQKLSQPPPSGIIQVNVNSQNTRIVFAKHGASAREWSLSAPSCNEFQTEAFEAASSDVGLSGASLATSSGSGAAVGALTEGECAWRFVILSSAQNDGMAMVLGVAGEAGLHGPAWGLLPAKGRVIATQTATEFGAWGAQLPGVSLQPGQANGALVDVRVSTDRRLLFRLSVPSSSYVSPWQDAQLSTALPPRVRPWALLMRSGDSVSLSRQPPPAA